VHEDEEDDGEDVSDADGDELELLFEVLPHAARASAPAASNVATLRPFNKGGLLPLHRRRCRCATLRP
jgi:hypothetical protein